MTKNNLNATSPESTKTDSCELKAAKSGPIHAFSPAPNLAQMKTNCCGDFGPDISAPGGVSARGICRTNCNLYLPLQDPSLFNLMVEQVGPVVTHTHTHTYGLHLIDARGVLFPGCEMEFTCHPRAGETKKRARRETMNQNTYAQLQV